MRLIDADEWVEAIKRETEKLPVMARDLNLFMINAINKQKTAYDVDKVMEKIDEIMKDESIRFVDQAVNRAKRIVKSGGIE